MIPLSIFKAFLRFRYWWFVFTVFQFTRLRRVTCNIQLLWLLRNLPLYVYILVWQCAILSLVMTLVLTIIWWWWYNSGVRHCRFLFSKGIYLFHLFLWLLHLFLYYSFNFTTIYENFLKYVGRLLRITYCLLQLHG